MGDNFIRPAFQMVVSCLVIAENVPIERKETLKMIRLIEIVILQDKDQVNPKILRLLYSVMDTLHQVKPAVQRRPVYMNGIIWLCGHSPHLPEKVSNELWPISPVWNYYSETFFGVFHSCFVSACKFSRLD